MSGLKVLMYYSRQYLGLYLGLTPLNRARSPAFPSRGNMGGAPAAKRRRAEEVL